MFQQPLVKAPVKFSDVVACFSEEEWKLLHEWQNELYNNVMKEIHQVLISLGPLIANSVFSLRVKEKEDVCPLKNRSAKRKSTVTVPPSDIHSNSDVSFGLNQDKTQYLLGPVDSDRRESNNCLTTGVIDSNPDFLFGINQENKQYLDEPPHSDRRESSNCLTTEHESGEPIVSVIIKEEGDTGYMGQDETLEHVSDHRDAGSMNINKSFGQSVKCDDKSAPCKSSTEKVKAKLIHNFVEKSHYTRQVWSGNDQEPSREHKQQDCAVCNLFKIKTTLRIRRDRRLAHNMKVAAEAEFLHGESHSKGEVDFGIPFQGGIIIASPHYVSADESSEEEVEVQVEEPTQKTQVPRLGLKGRQHQGP
ncbi:hypothetical protein NDU88_006128 [Pleurodeles waltl]|uniref:KRAB domain-containing protein n=1 Tax=Pleurodeles waltl TaxID=8319 RepID=A0AAV7QGP7_PLEWA|nr:hypothetical protein NDU88_006128 [Pleurodeles waltl]